MEIDGKIHARRKEQDQLRTSIINDLGMKVIRFKNEELEMNLERVMQDLRRYLSGEKERGVQKSKQSNAVNE